MWNNKHTVTSHPLPSACSLLTWGEQICAPVQSRVCHAALSPGSNSGTSPSTPGPGLVSGGVAAALDRSLALRGSPGRRVPSQGSDGWGAPWAASSEKKKTLWASPGWVWTTDTVPGETWQVISASPAQHPLPRLPPVVAVPLPETPKLRHKS